MATSDSFIKQELKDLWSVDPMNFKYFYINSQESIDTLLNKIPHKFGDEALDSGENPGPPPLDKTVNNPKEVFHTASLLHLKSGDNKAKVIKEHMREHLGLALEEVRKYKLNGADKYIRYII